MKKEADQGRAGLVRDIVRPPVRAAARTRTGERALPAGVAVAAGVLAGAVTVQVVGLSVVTGVAVGIVTAAWVFSKGGVLDALRGPLSRPS